ncbi:MAG: hypothetical protein V3T31_03605, partial [candidate division Zixibacteria bacterium]
MTTFPNSPKLLKGGIVLIDPNSAAVQKIITLQYNPETLSRSLAVQSVGEGGTRSDALRLNGPPIETFKVDTEIDATDRLEFPDQFPGATELGVFPEIAILEMLVYPSSAQLTGS